MQNNEYKTIIDALDWRVIYHNDAREYMLIDKNTNEFFYLDLVAKLTYSINDTPTDEFDTLFNNDCCGECVYEDRIEFLWFKEKSITIDIKGV